MTTSLSAGHDFDILDELALKSDADVDALVSTELLATLQRVEALLVVKPQRQISRANFVSRMRQLRELKHRGSLDLGDAILRASELVDHQRIPEACEVYEQFLLACESPFYRRIAEHQLRNLSTD